MKKQLQEQVRLSSKISQTVKGKLSWGVRVVKVGGGMGRVFKNLFRSVGEEDRLLKASQCYLSTTDGPIPGLLFISSQYIAFCSHKSLKLLSPNGESLKVHYKVRKTSRF